MNTQQLIAAAVLALVGSSAFAADIEGTIVPASTLTRAEVRADLARAQSRHELPFNDQQSYFIGNASTSQASTVTCAEVRAELARARANNELQVNDLASYDVHTSQPAAASTLTRAEVRAQARAYVHSGQSSRDSIDMYKVGG